MFVTARDELEIVHKTCECTRTLQRMYRRNDFKRTQLLRSARTYKMFVTVRYELEIVHKTFERTQALLQKLSRIYFKQTQFL